MMPPGFRFYPTEEELVGFYLREKLQGRRNNQLQQLIPILDIYDHTPWDLPQLSGGQCREDPQLQEWFFFIPQQEKEARGGRPNRLTSIGYWKATGSPGFVYSSSDNRVIGEKRTMVFYTGRAPGSKTDWKMNEYRAIDLHADSTPQMRLEFSLCRVYTRSKCIRSFDRRPPTSAPRVVTTIPPSITVTMTTTTTTTTTSRDGSGSSRDNNSSSPESDVRNAQNTSQMTTKTTTRGGVEGILNIGDAPLWEWEQYLEPADYMLI